ncbi:MAG TPA: cytochrome c oxidase assembly protein [Acidimicrobiales bacterium]|nr:cytochrome c oxidase assembly protein [Acidimicrobiales bacterium]
MLGVTPSPWEFQPHPEVWLLLGGLTAAYVYMVKVLGPRAVPPGQPPVTRTQVALFSVSMVVLWIASDWPVHDIGERDLYWVHMVQHLLLSYVLPPLFLLATPEWLLRTLIGTGRLQRVVRWLTQPVVAAVGFNAIVILTHIPGVVNESATNAVLHYTLHVALVTMSILYWMPVCGPLPEYRLAPGPKMIYLFAASIIPTVPAGWLAFAEGSVYNVYDVPDRAFSMSVTTDQQLAGVIMKIGGSLYMWTIITVIFFRRFMAGWEQQQSFRRATRVPDSEIVGHAERPLTFDEVSREFEKVPPPREPD